MRRGAPSRRRAMSLLLAQRRRICGMFGAYLIWL
jgi:hypothetical protein